MQPHRFVSIIGFVVASLSVYFIYNGSSELGWGLSLLILALGVFALAGWCAGCFTYYLLNKAGLKGFFKHSPVENSFPGMRTPKGQ